MDEHSEDPAGSGPKVDARLLGAYLNDHLAGAVAGSRRFRRTAEALRSTPVGPALAEVAWQVTDEKHELRRIVLDLAVNQNPVKQAVARIGESTARPLEALRGVARRGRLATLLEVELLRAALLGKLGVWQTLRDVGPDLGLDTQRFEVLRLRTQDQVAVLDEVHAYVRRRALMPPRPAS